MIIISIKLKNLFYRIIYQKFWQSIDMFIVIIRAILILALVFLFIRLMGKRQIGEMQPLELVMTLIIAEVACVPMSDPGIPLTYGIIPIATLFLIHFALSYL